MYREKIELFLDSIAGSSDAEFADTIQDLTESAAEYLKRVTVLEAARSVAKLNRDGNEYGEYIQQLDSERSAAHNKLISNVKLLNKLCRLHEIPVLFEGNEDKRIEIADFAQQFINEYFSTRKL